MRLHIKTFNGRRMEVDLGTDPDVERSIDFTKEAIEAHHQQTLRARGDEATEGEVEPA